MFCSKTVIYAAYIVYMLLATTCAAAIACLCWCQTGSYLVATIGAYAVFHLFAFLLILQRREARHLEEEFLLELSENNEGKPLV